MLRFSQLFDTHCVPGRLFINIIRRDVLNRNKPPLNMIRIREAQMQDSAAIAKVHVDSWRTTYKGIVSDDYLSAMSYTEREQRWQEFFEDTDHFQFVYLAEE